MLRTLKALRSIDPTFLLGVTLTAVFYYAILQPGMRGSILYLYTTEHVVEYVIVALFMWGIADVLWKLIGFPLELLALRQVDLSAGNEEQETVAISSMLERLNSRPKWIVESKVGQRLQRALESAASNNPTKDFGDQLKEIKEQDEDNTYTRYTLIRFVASVTPILGFLGTVVHFGTALSGISFTEIGERLPALVGEMGMAFNTTTVALAAATTMAFALFLCERIERGIDDSVTRLVHRKLSTRVPKRTLQIAPFLAVIQNANEEALVALQSALKQQIESWTRLFEKLFQRFDSRQEHELKNWRTLAKFLQRRFEEQDSRHAERLRLSLTTVESSQDKHMGQIQSLLERVAGWKDEFASFSQSLESILKGETHLTTIQSTLNENLRLLHVTSRMDEAFHGLTAAIHLLTARQHAGKPDSAAA